MTENKNELAPWQRGGPSPNPKGRPRGVKDRRTLATERLMNAVDEISEVVITEAKEGDMQAAGLIFGRVLPALAPQSEKVKFDLDTTAPLAKQVEQVLAAVATGLVSADIAKKIIDAIASLGSIRQLDDLEERIAKLEVIS